MKKNFWSSRLPRPGTTERGPEQPETIFERRFRMPRTIFNRICALAVSHSDYLRQGLRPDCSGIMGISPLLKVICALVQLSYGIPAYLSDDLFYISESTAALCLEHFCLGVKAAFCAIYLREPTIADINRIESEFRAVGFPSCIGCLDCSGCAWKNCPKALQVIMVGKYGHANVRMEVICSLDLSIWSFQFGLLGAMNELNILEVINHSSCVLGGGCHRQRHGIKLDQVNMVGITT